MLASQVHNYNQAAAASDTIALKGVAIGNGCIGFDVDGGCGRDSLELFVATMEQVIGRHSKPELNVDCSCLPRLLQTRVHQE
jgi:hypothetical protein